MNVRFFSHFFQSNISCKKTEQWPTFSHSHPEGWGICHSVLWVNVCLQYRILGLRMESLSDSFLHVCNFVGSVTSKILLQRTEISVINYHSVACKIPKECRSHLHHCSSLKSHILSKLLQQGSRLSPSALHRFSLLAKHLGGHRCQSDAEVQETVW